MRVVGIDPGSLACGYGIVEHAAGGTLRCVDYGTIVLPARDELHDRLRLLHETLLEMLRRNRPDEAAVEKVFFARSVKSALSLGQARGVALLCIAEAGIPYGEYSPNEVKKAVVGYGKAEKRQVQEMVRMILSLGELPPPDSADALALAICHLNQFRPEG
jgi:crossover junction endodeoxyribonuclease RuvC